MNKAYLSLGSNEGEREKWINNAISILNQTAGVVTRISSLYETKAWGLSEQPDFLNACLLLETKLNEFELLEVIKATETQLGRQRTIKWGPRTLDIDILFFNNDVIDAGEITVPHPYLQDRKFVLLPLADIASDYQHPVSGKTVSQLLAECTDSLEIRKC